MASLTCLDNGEDNPKKVTGSGSGVLCRFKSDSESDSGPVAKSLARLCSRDEGERASALEELSQKVLVRLGMDRSDSEQLSKQTLLQLLRLSNSCPLQEVRAKATDLLRTAQVRSILYTYSANVLYKIFDVYVTNILFWSEFN